MWLHSLTDLHISLVSTHAKYFLKLWDMKLIAQFVISTMNYEVESALGENIQLDFITFTVSVEMLTIYHAI